MASGQYSHAEGYYSIASAGNAHSEGSETVAGGYGSHAEGLGHWQQLSITGEANSTTYTYTFTNSTNDYSYIAQGKIIYYNYQYAKIVSYDETTSTITLDKTLNPNNAINSAPAFLYYNGAYGIGSHVEGGGTIASSNYQHVQGKYNIEDANNKYAHIVGKGQSHNTRSNAHTLDWDGNAWFAGDVYVGSTSGTNKDDGSKKVATEEYTDTAIANLVNSAPETLDTLGELATAFQENKEVVDALDSAITNKQDKLSGLEGQIVGFDADGNAITQENPQANWNQNDATALDYVKNRTHWVQTAETLLNNEVFECTTLASDGESYYAAKSGNIGLVNNGVYEVIVNGTTYSATALVGFGTNDIALIAEVDECRIYDRESGVVEVFSDASRTLTITIKETEDVYIPLDEKFIPDVFARSADVELKMDKENPAGTGSFSMNRASGSEIGENSVAIGTDCVASGASAVAIGSGAMAIGFASHAEGSGTVAQGELAHAEGQDAVANGYASHAESSSEANGDYSHAEGYGIADGDYSHASGNGTWAVGRSQTVIGEANYEDEAEDATTRGTYAFIIGNGDLEAGEYSNAHTLDWQGNAWFQGDVYVGSTDGINRDDGSVKLVKETDLAQSDWNQNDETALDYVKNRTHWKEETTEVLLSEISISNGGKNLSDVMQNERMGSEEKFIITVDDISYKCESWAVIGEPCIGDSRLFDDPIRKEEHIENVPFLVHLYVEIIEDMDAGTFEEIAYWNVYLSDTNTHTIKIERILEGEYIYHRLDKNYLPMDDIYNDIMARISNAEEASF